MFEWQDSKEVKPEMCEEEEVDIFWRVWEVEKREKWVVKKWVGVCTGRVRKLNRKLDRS